MLSQVLGCKIFWILNGRNKSLPMVITSTEVNSWVNGYPTNHWTWWSHGFCCQNYKKRLHNGASMLQECLLVGKLKCTVYEKINYLHVFNVLFNTKK